MMRFLANEVSRRWTASPGRPRSGSVSEPEPLRRGASSAAASGAGRSGTAVVLAMAGRRRGRARLKSRRASLRGGNEAARERGAKSDEGERDGADKSETWS